MGLTFCLQQLFKLTKAKEHRLFAYSIQGLNGVTPKLVPSWEPRISKQHDSEEPASPASVSFTVVTKTFPITHSSCEELQVDQAAG